MQFRADIEGLRGVAILLVVLAHAGVPGLQGGFIGVDVFFVISGYLITGQLLSELRTRDQIDYWAFFERRVRRLVPALLLMLAVVVPMAALLLPPSVFSDQLSAARWAALWVSNIYFAVADYGYFDHDATSNLFLHTWSLGVEEQFYLLWPAVMAIAWKKGFRSWPFYAGLSACGYLLCVAVSRWDAMAAYYLMPTRLWQLAAGAAAYVATTSRANISRGAGMIGTALVVVSLLLIDESSPYPGMIALLPTLGAVLLVVGGGGNRWLATPPLRFLGKVSYSWYLWHWPFLAILPAMAFGEPTRPQRLALVLVSLLVAWGSCILVEQPLRRRRSITPRLAVVAGVLGALAVTAGLQWSIGVSHLAEQDLAKQESFESRIKARITVPDIYSTPGCDQWYHSSDVVPCRIGTDGGVNGTMVVLADSVGAQWLPALEPLARNRGLDLVVMTKSACLIANVPFVYERIKRRYVECEQWRARAIEVIGKIRPKVLVIGSSGAYPIVATQWRDGTAAVLGSLASPEMELLVLAPTPILPFSAPNCIATRGRERRDGFLDAPDCAAPLKEVEHTDVISALKSATTGVERAHFVDLNDLVCPQGACSASVNGQLAYRDAQHLNASYVQSLSDAVMRRVGPMLTSSKGPKGSTAASSSGRTVN
ncbi:acyltransferase family protein [Lysobacter sp.]|uniref:acyltransferase family protein n=1 Tax=Lysobacter sp. TaxID=72226 RepID=UPI002D3C299D|nr:acyltransferase family protein [Lysobacter sp.]HZX77217.1 acyltransferase family protein [Lysobacter sp.]